jgi:hypothetical protein
MTKINWLTLFKEIIAVYSENHMKQIMHSVGKIQIYRMPKQVLRIVTTELWRAKRQLKAEHYISLSLSLSLSKEDGQP